MRASTTRTALVGVVARLHEADAFPLNEAARILYHLKYEPFGDEYPSEFWGFWDELDLAEQGYLPQHPEEVRRRLKGMLESFCEYAKWFQPTR